MADHPSPGGVVRAASMPMAAWASSRSLSARMWSKTPRLLASSTSASPHPCDQIAHFVGRCRISPCSSGTIVAFVLVQRFAPVAPDAIGRICCASPGRGRPGAAGGLARAGALKARGRGLRLAGHRRRADAVPWPKSGLRRTVGRYPAGRSRAKMRRISSEVR